MDSPDDQPQRSLPGTTARTIICFWLGMLGLLGTGCVTSGMPAAGRGKPVVRQLQATAYCPCQKCCGWIQNSQGLPVYASGSMKGKAKQVGITSSGTRARHGTIAADVASYPYGTIMYITGYGYGRVEDIGGDIKGHRIDLFFESHNDALKWGRRNLPVQIWPAERGQK